MDDSPDYLGRFAPSPTGALHFGSLFVAFSSWLMARCRQGRWLIRMEDLDPPREVPGAACDQLRTLASFGLLSDDAVLWQRDRHAVYQSALQRLLARNQAFECHCSRTDLADQGGVHRRCKPGTRRPDPAIRLRVPDGTRIQFDDSIQGAQTQNVAKEVGDFVLRRSDRLWAYQLAVVVDDAAQGITDVVRGADLLDSTPRQILLQRLLNLPAIRYAHLPLVLDAQGRKLSKSSTSLPVDPRAPVPALRTVWSMLGQAPEHLPSGNDLTAVLQAAVASIEPKRIPKVLLPSVNISQR